MVKGPGDVTRLQDIFVDEHRQKKNQGQKKDCSQEDSPEKAYSKKKQQAPKAFSKNRRGGLAWPDLASRIAGCRDLPGFAVTLDGLSQSPGDHGI
jgi:hypothetical protein